jgi:TRAP-type uncharacterized transport system substrate-binding protein
VSQWTKIAMMWTRYLLFLAATIASLTAAVTIYVIYSQPLHLRIAVGPDGGTDANIFGALERILAADHSTVRLDLVTTSGTHENNSLLEKREVDLAVLRADEPLPGGAALLAVLRTNVAVLVAPARHKLESISELKGKRLGLVVRSAQDEAIATRLLDSFNLKPADVSLTAIKASDVGALTKSGKFHAVLVFGAPTDPEVSGVVYAVDYKRKEGPSILAIEIGDFSKGSSAAASSATIAKLAFPRRGIPEEEVESVGVPTVLAANRASSRPLKGKLYNNAITELTKTLLQRHGEIARRIPLASLITAPDDDKSSRLPVHAGATAYLADTDVSWATFFSEQIWNVVLIGGILSSLFAAIWSFLKPRRLDPLRRLLDRLSAITSQAQTSSGQREYETLSKNLSNIGVEIATLAYERGSTYEQFAPVQLAYESAYRAVEAMRIEKKA